MWLTILVVTFNEIGKSDRAILHISRDTKFLFYLVASNVYINYFLNTCTIYRIIIITHAIIAYVEKSIFKLKLFEILIVI